VGNGWKQVNELSLSAAAARSLLAVQVGGISPPTEVPRLSYATGCTVSTVPLHMIPMEHLFAHMPSLTKPLASRRDARDASAAKDVRVSCYYNSSLSLPFTITSLFGTVCVVSKLISCISSCHIYNLGVLFRSFRPVSFIPSVLPQGGRCLANISIPVSRYPDRIP
jgi:hypothetical protein